MPFAHVLKQWLSVPEYDRVNEQVVFINQAKIGQLLYDARTSGDQHVLARFLLHLFDLFGNYLCLECGVAPGKIFHIFGEDDFAYTIHCMRRFGIALERFGISVGCRPIGCHDLVRYFTQEQCIGIRIDIAHILLPISWLKVVVTQSILSSESDIKSSNE